MKKQQKNEIELKKTKNSLKKKTIEQNIKNSNEINKLKKIQNYLKNKLEKNNIKELEQKIKQEQNKKNKNKINQILNERENLKQNKFNFYQNKNHSHINNIKNNNQIIINKIEQFKKEFQILEIKEKECLNSLNNTKKNSQKMLFDFNKTDFNKKNIKKRSNSVLFHKDYSNIIKPFHTGKNQKDDYYFTHSNVKTNFLRNNNK